MPIKKRGTEEEILGRVKFKRFHTGDDKRMFGSDPATLRSYFSSFIGTSGYESPLNKLAEFFFDAYGEGVYIGSDEGVKRSIAFWQISKAVDSNGKRLVDMQDLTFDKWYETVKSEMSNYNYDLLSMADSQGNNSFDVVMELISRKNFSVNLPLKKSPMYDLIEMLNKAKEKDPEGFAKKCEELVKARKKAVSERNEEIDRIKNAKGSRDKINAVKEPLDYFKNSDGAKHLMQICRDNKIEGEFLDQSLYQMFYETADGKKCLDNAEATYDKLVADIDKSVEIEALKKKYRNDEKHALSYKKISNRYMDFGGTHVRFDTDRDVAVNSMKTEEDKLTLEIFKEEHGKDILLWKKEQYAEAEKKAYGEPNTVYEKTMKACCESYIKAKNNYKIVQNHFEGLSQIWDDINTKSRGRSNSVEWDNFAKKLDTLKEEFSAGSLNDLKEVTKKINDAVIDLRENALSYIEKIGNDSFAATFEKGRERISLAARVIEETNKFLDEKKCEQGYAEPKEGETLGHANANRIISYQDMISHYTNKNTNIEKAIEKGSWTGADYGRAL